MQSWPVNAATADGTQEGQRWPRQVDKLDSQFAQLLEYSRQYLGEKQVERISDLTQAVRCFFDLLQEKDPSYQFRDIYPKIPRCTELTCLTLYYSVYSLLLVR
jgi:hypothetical protein